MSGTIGLPQDVFEKAVKSKEKISKKLGFSDMSWKMWFEYVLALLEKEK